MRDEGRTFRFTLRPDVRSHDGHPLTAQVVKASFERAIRGAASTCRRGSRPSSARRTCAGAPRNWPACLRPTATSKSASRTPCRSTRRCSTDRAPRSCARRPGRVRFPSAQALSGSVSRSGEGRPAAPRRLLERNAGQTRDDRVSRGMSAAALAAGFSAGELDMARDLNPNDLEEMLRDPRYHDCLIEAPQKFTYFVLFNTISGSVASAAAVRRALSGSLRARDLVWQSRAGSPSRRPALFRPGSSVTTPGAGTAAARRRGGARTAALGRARRKVRLRASVHPLFQDRYASLLEALLAAWAELGVEVWSRRPGPSRT